MMINDTKPIVIIKLGSNGRDCSVRINGEDISRVVRRIVIDAQPIELTKVWIEISPIVTQFEIEELENVQFYNGVPEDMPFKLKGNPR